jgi:hypothetical protein
MKRYKRVRFVDAEPMFQSNAEEVIGKKITNLTHGNDGYLVDDPDDGISWVPKSVFEKDAIPAHTHSEILNMMIVEVSNHMEELKSYTRHGKPQKNERDAVYMAIRRGTQYISDLQKAINCLRK